MWTLISPWMTIAPGCTFRGPPESMVSAWCTAALKKDSSLQWHRCFTPGNWQNFNGGYDSSCWMVVAEAPSEGETAEPMFDLTHSSPTLRAKAATRAKSLAAVLSPGSFTLASSRHKAAKMGPKESPATAQRQAPLHSGARISWSRSTHTSRQIASPINGRS